VSARRVDVLLICGGKFHDMDYARLELLKLFAEHDQVRVKVREDYADLAALDHARLLVTYTCEVIPDEAQTAALEQFVRRGGRWLALHGTNSVLKYVKGKGWDAPRIAPAFMRLLGSQFVAHPPIAPYRVRFARADDPLVQGLSEFDADDELYLMELHEGIDVLMYAEFAGDAPGFVESSWQSAVPRPVLYRRVVGAGEIVYCTLGHARGRYDMQPLMDEYPRVERGSWKQPAFHEILRRGIRWGIAARAAV
jgi:type 1 glutamine amidotransferase